MLSACLYSHRIRIHTRGRGASRQKWKNTQHHGSASGRSSTIMQVQALPLNLTCSVVEKDGWFRCCLHRRQLLHPSLFRPHGRWPWPLLMCSTIRCSSWKCGGRHGKRRMEYKPVVVETGKRIRLEEACTPGEEDGWWGPQWVGDGQGAVKSHEILTLREKFKHSKSLHYRQGVYIEKNERCIINTEEFS